MTEELGVSTADAGAAPGPGPLSTSAASVPSDDGCNNVP